MLYKTYQEIYIHVYVYNLKIMKFIIQTGFSKHMDFLMNQLLVMLNGNCQLIQCTHITDLLSNLKGLLDSMIFLLLCKLMSHVH